MRFIDRSNVNGADNLRQAGVTHLYLKATEGVSYVDATFARRRSQAHAAGVIVGAYHFASLDNPVAECDHFLGVIGATSPGEFRPCLDLERGTVVSDVAWAEAWVSHFRSRRGYLPVIYGSTSLIGPLRSRSKLLAACPWWRAEYGPNDGRITPLAGGRMGATAHQYTSVAVFPGISGHTDASVFVAPITPMLVPHPHTSVRITKAAWDWAQWWLSIGRYKGHGHGEHVHSRGPGQKDGRVPVPKTGWKAVAWYLKHRRPGS